MRVRNLILGLVALAAASCQSSQILAPSGTSFVFSSPTTMTSDGTIEITVTAMQGFFGTGTTTGNQQSTTTATSQPVHDHTVVGFSTTLGLLDPVSATTVNGRVVLHLTGDGRTGSAKVTATSGAATGTTTITITAPAGSGQ